MTPTVVSQRVETIPDQRYKRGRRENRIHNPNASVSYDATHVTKILVAFRVIAPRYIVLSDRQPLLCFHLPAPAGDYAERKGVAVWHTQYDVEMSEVIRRPPPRARDQNMLRTYSSSIIVSSISLGGRSSLYGTKSSGVSNQSRLIWAVNKRDWYGLI